MVNNYTYLKIFLNDLNKQVTLSELESYFNKPHQTVKAHLQPLIKSKILNIKKSGRFSFYSLNLNNPLLKDYLSICEKEVFFTFLKNNPLFERLYQIVKNYKVLLFGSAVNSKDYNDIDLLIIGKKPSGLEDFDKTYSARTHLIITNEKNLTKTLINEIKKKHIMFSNHDYFINLLYKNELRLV